MQAARAAWRLAWSNAPSRRCACLRWHERPFRSGARRARRAQGSHVGPSIEARERSAHGARSRARPPQKVRGRLIRSQAAIRTLRSPTAREVVRGQPSAAIRGECHGHTLVRPKLLPPTSVNRFNCDKWTLRMSQRPIETVCNATAINREGTRRVTAQRAFMFRSAIIE